MKWIVALFGWIARWRTKPQITSQQKKPRSLAWGQKVSAQFRERIFEISHVLGAHPDDLMACIAFETAETFRPDIKNAAGSGATGLIQFMPRTALSLVFPDLKIGRMSATDLKAKSQQAVDHLARMSAVEQLDYVHLYFKPYTGRLKSLPDVYMAILWPAGIGKPDDWVLWHKGERPKTYRQNAGLDANKDGVITKAEAAGKVLAKLHEGRQAANLWVEP
ncbi:hypothetical protein ACMHYO_16245 [Allopusillimonas ginsengisoli]|uniref:hypothetical protein n=1 Tax=Allopusillimonas ginsengisoli TaxID=453575 RepID=UPI0039C20F35